MQYRIRRIGSPETQVAVVAGEREALPQQPRQAMPHPERLAMLQQEGEEGEAEMALRRSSWLFSRTPTACR